MATFKEYIFVNNRRKDGTYAVSIRVTHNRRSRYIPTNIYVNDSQITRTGKIKDRYIQDIIDKKLKEYREKSYAFSIGSENLSVDEFINILNRADSNVDFFSFAYREIAVIKRNGRDVGGYISAIRDLQKFIGSETLPFDRMKKSLMQEYYDNLLTRVSTYTASLYFANIKHIHKMAISKLNDEELGVNIVKYHCFEGIIIDSQEKNVSKSFDTVEQMQKVIDCDYTKSTLTNFCKDMFILSFLLNGMNMHDIYELRNSQYKDGFITFYRSKIHRKTGENSRSVIKVLPIVKMIIEKYRGDPEYLIYMPKRYVQKNFTNRQILNIFSIVGIDNCYSRSDIDENNIIGRPRKKYTFNTARHTMATFCRNMCGVSKDIVDMMLVHTTRAVDVYYKKPYELMWEANEKLYSLFDWTKYEQMLKETTK